MEKVEQRTLPELILSFGNVYDIFSFGKPSLCRDFPFPKCLPQEVKHLGWKIKLFSHSEFEMIFHLLCFT